MTPEQKLMALLQAQTPPEHDPLFEIAVQERLARQRAFQRFTFMAMAVIAISGLAAGLGWAIFKGGVSASLPILAAVGAMGIAGLVIRTLRQV